MLKGYVDAYRVFNKAEYLEIAIKNAKFLLKNQLRKDGGLFHNYKDGKSSINGYLEDYAAVIEAYTSLYEVTLNQNWLNTANSLTEYCFKHFYNKELHMFYFTSDEDKSLITRKMEINDNVIPASNSIMAKNLFKLGHYFENKTYNTTAKQMLNNVKNDIEKYPSGYSNWLLLQADLTSNFYEVAVVGKDAFNKIKKINQVYIPNKLIVGSTIESDEPLLKYRYSEENTQIFICIDGACKLPLTSTEKQLSN
jgi:uncharacterized protein YyaL (SSP411 family)